MLLPPLHTHQGYVNLAKDAGLSGFAEPKDISQDVAKTWFVVPFPFLQIRVSIGVLWWFLTFSRDISWSLVQNPSLWAFAVSQGRDGIAFLQAFRAMRRGYSNGSFRYAVMAFNKE
jgi:tocopherol O-methyltransferase